MIGSVLGQMEWRKQLFDNQVLIKSATYPQIET